MDKAQALHQFWSSFGVDAYDENSVPDNAMLPYITYNVATDSLGNVVSLHADLWDKSTSWRYVTQLSEKIAQKIKQHNDYTIKFDGGYIYLCDGTPFAQRIGDPEKDIKRIYINVQAEYLCKY